MDDIIKIVKLNDAHVPFEDKQAVQVAIEFCERLQPDIIVTDEWMDFYELSRFVKDPTRATGYTLNDAREQTFEWFKRLGQVCPMARRVHLNANHPKRMQKYLNKNAPELVGLPEFEMDNFMKFKEYNIEYHQYFTFRDFLFKHGDRIHKYSGYTAKNEFESEGMSGASGHSHRLSQHYRTLRGGKYTWIECGCLCDLNQEYLEGKISDWQHGIGLVIFWGTHFRAIPLPIIDRKIDWI